MRCADDEIDMGLTPPMRSIGDQYSVYLRRRAHRVVKASGLEAVNIAAQKIASGGEELVVAGAAFASESIRQFRMSFTRALSGATHSLE